MKGIYLNPEGDGVQRHDYHRRFLVLLDSGAIPPLTGLNDLTIKHDGWCPFLRNHDSLCICDPLFVLNGVQVT